MDLKFCTACGASWQSGVYNDQCPSCTERLNSVRRSQEQSGVAEPPSLPEFADRPILQNEEPAPPDRPPQPLKPFRYPAWLVLFTIAVVLAFGYSLTLLPPYYHKGKLLSDGRRALEHGDFVNANRSLSTLLTLAPTSKTARISLAIAYFKQPDRSLQVRGLALLQGVVLKNDDWKAVEAAMPADFRRFFSSKENR